MQIQLDSTAVDFRPWRPADGRVFTDTIAVDAETTRIDENRPWLTPAYVLGAACDDTQGFFIHRKHLKDFLIAHRGIPLVFHNAPFDLAVIHQVAPELDIYHRVELGEAIASAFAFFYSFIRV